MFRSDVTKGVAIGCPSLYLNDSPCLGKHLKLKFQKLPKDISDAKIAFSLNVHPNSVFNKMAVSYVKRSNTSKIIMQDVRDVHASGLSSSSDKVVDFKEVESWKTFLQSFDLLVSGRIHGAMMGIYAGIPTIVVADDYRIRELSERMYLPSFVRRLTPSHDVRYIYNNFVFNPNAFDHNRAMTLYTYERMFARSGLSLHPRMLKIRKDCHSFYYEADTEKNESSA